MRISRVQLAYRLLELTAISAELPAGMLIRLHESPSYLEAVIRGLKKDKLLRVYYRDKVRSYWLCVKAKDFLLADNYAGVYFHSPAFYSSREIKETGLETVKIRGSRMDKNITMQDLRSKEVAVFSMIPGINELLQATPAEKAEVEAKYPDVVFAVVIASSLFNHNRNLSEITRKAHFSILNGANITNVRFRYDRETDEYWKKHMWDD